MISFEKILRVKSVLDNAYCDLVYLLDNGYSKTTALNFVADHYVLEKGLRTILNRVSFSKEEVVQIRSKQIKSVASLSKSTMFVDVYNQLISFFSILNKDPLLICRDGLIRDIFSLIHYRSDFVIERPLIISFLRAIKLLSPKKVIFYLDSPVSHSALHCKLINESIVELDLDAECLCVKSVDYELKTKDYGVTLSHDSIVILNTYSFFDFIIWCFNSLFGSSYPISHILDFSKRTC